MNAFATDAAPPERRDLPDFGAALLFASGFPVQYRVLRAVSEVFDRTFAVGTGSASTLGRSKFCERYYQLPETAFSGEGAIGTIETICADHEISMIIPADATTTRFVAAHRESLPRRCFPTPGPTEFDRLDNKWSFYQLCAELSVPTPPTHRFDTVAEAQGFLKRHPDCLPGIVKPLELYGSIGVQSIQSPQELSGIDYQPILYQALAAGSDLDMSVITRDGRIENYCIYMKRNGRYHYIENDDLYGAVEVIVAHLGLSGVQNFGSMMDDAGNVLMTECNPRFWRTLDCAQVCGMNFVAEALVPGARRNPLLGRTVGSLKGIAYQALRYAKLRDADGEMLRYVMTDAMPQMLGRKVLF